MKSIFKIAFIAAIAFTINANAQMKGNQTLGNNAINLSSAFIDASSSTIWNGATPGATNVGKGLLFPKADLGTLVLTNSGAYLSSNNPNRFDGMVVYNTVTSATTATGITTAVVPGFYYFSNPTRGTPSASVGQWLPLGGSSATIKSKTVTGVVADGVSATLNLGTTVITANEVVELVSAKVYNAAGDLVIGAFSDYTKATNILTTGSGFINTVMPAGTYKVVVEYK